VAPIRLVLSREFLLGDDVQVEAVQRAVRDDFDGRLNREFEVPFVADAAVVRTGGQLLVELKVSGELEADSIYSARNAIDKLAGTLTKAFRSKTQWFSRNLSRIDNEQKAILVQLYEQLMGQPWAVLTMPLLGCDREVVESRRAAQRAHDAAVRETVMFWCDQDDQIDAVNIDVRVPEKRLRISGAPEDVAASAKSYVSATRRRSRPLELNPRTPVWAIASAVIAVVTVGMSFMRLNWITLALLGVAVGALVTASMVLARRWNADVKVTVLGLAPVLLLSAFAIVYGSFALAAPAALQVGGSGVHHLREPLLLSLSLLTTTGAFDLALRGWVRSVAYLEMLLVASLAGGAAIFAVRRLSQRANDLIGQIGPRG
jgi:hypothetical protein